MKKAGMSERDKREKVLILLHCSNFFCFLSWYFTVVKIQQEKWHFSQNLKHRYLRVGNFNEIVKKLFSNHDNCQLQKQFIETTTRITLVSFEFGKTIFSFMSRIFECSSFDKSNVNQLSVKIEDLEQKNFDGVWLFKVCLGSWILNFGQP